MNGNELTPHQRYVEAGHCPAVHWTRAWCNGDAGHDGDHWAPPYLHPDGSISEETWPQPLAGGFQATEGLSATAGTESEES